MDIARRATLTLGVVLAFHAPASSSRGLHAHQALEVAPPDSTVVRRFAVTAVMVSESDHWRIRVLRAYLLSADARVRKSMRTV